MRFVISPKRGYDLEELHTRVAIQISFASALASKRETVRVIRSLQRGRADRAKVDCAFRDMTSRRRGGKPHGQPITIHKGDVVEVGIPSLTQR